MPQLKSSPVIMKSPLTTTKTQHSQKKDNDTSLPFCMPVRVLGAFWRRLVVILSMRR